jgi:hypothetical protein
MNACKGKVLFKDLTIAIRALKKMNRRDSALQIYKCEDCKGYHIGSCQVSRNNHLGRGYGHLQQIPKSQKRL